MCGIVGISLPRSTSGEWRESERSRIRRMVAALQHRGPDALQALVLDDVALGHARLSVVDLASGSQPMRDEATGVTIVFNGEIFNYLELRQRLAARYAFRTRSDTEVLLAAFLAEGIECVNSFNGQFAFAIHDPRDGSLWLARDRFGERPLFYTYGPSGFAFASEAKALFAGGLVAPELDPFALMETLHLWAPTEQRSAFKGVYSLPPASIACVRDGRLEVRRYWALDLSDDRIDRSLTIERATDELEALLDDAVGLRLRADVPVGAYLSGGLDSSLICAIAQERLGGTLQTFSVSFQQERYDEGAFQRGVAASLGTEHFTVSVGDGEIGQLLPAVVEHTEATLLRTAPAPLLKLSGLVRNHGTKVVLTGEGADELFLGYDLYKETRVRQFWARFPSSRIRPRLFERLYPYLAVSRQSPQLIERFFGNGLEQVGTLGDSHRLRWANSGRVSRFLSTAFVERLGGWDPVEAFLDGIPPELKRWRPLAKAQALELRTLLSQYLLSSQGDRVMMANAVEGRLPFLDHRIAEFAARLPDTFKLRGLREKAILRRIGRKRLPPQVLERRKFPYRAPIAESLVGANAPEWATELLSRAHVDAVGIFDGHKVERLVAKLAAADAPPSDADDMALAAIATTQLLARRFLADREIPSTHLDAVRVRAA